MMLRATIFVVLDVVRVAVFDKSVVDDAVVVDIRSFLSVIALCVVISSNFVDFVCTID